MPAETLPSLAIVARFLGPVKGKRQNTTQRQPTIYS